ncbi:MAG TPA: transketolase C-terminal domain-containing protein [Mycobacteriales bacterium]|nr:transketolase C-terminal domain-containing protein [Mycobacteriales bacterium]
MTTTYMARAIADALNEAMAEDPSVMVIGEDVELSTIGATKGLVERFGQNRVRNSPISEATVVGACVGAAACGVRPVMDLMFSSFFYVALDQVANQAARLRYMSGGQVELPLVLFTGTGPSGSAAAQHSENPHPLLMSLSGVKVVFPSTPADARALLVESVRDPNPVVFLLDLMLAGSKGEISDPPHRVPLGKGVIRRVGTDVTVVAIGSAVPQSLEAAEVLANEGVAVEVIDPRTLVPLDDELIESSVRRTGRLVVADPARATCGAAAEIITRVVDRCWMDLRSAPVRVAWEDVPIPYAPALESHVTLTADKIAAAIRAAVA